MLIGVDYHPSFQQIAFLVKETGEYGERRLNHSDGEAEKFYRDLQLRGAPVQVGMEATGYSRWFERLLAELGFEVWIGDAAEIQASRVKKHKTDRKDAQLLLKLMMEDRFPRIWVAGPENRDLRQLLWHRHRLVQMRTRIMNQLQALAMNEGYRWKKKLFSEQGRGQLEKLALAPWASRRRQELLELLDRMNPTIEELTAAVEREARKRPEALRLLMVKADGCVGFGIHVSRAAGEAWSMTALQGLRDGARGDRAGAAVANDAGGLPQLELAQARFGHEEARLDRARRQQLDTEGIDEARGVEAAVAAHDVGEVTEDLDALPGQAGFGLVEEGLNLRAQPGFRLADPALELQVLAANVVEHAAGGADEGLPEALRLRRLRVVRRAGRGVPRCRRIFPDCHGCRRQAAGIDAAAAAAVDLGRARRIHGSAEGGEGGPQREAARVGARRCLPRRVLRRSPGRRRG